MALSIAGFVVIGTATPSEDPVRIGYVWMDSSTNKLKICTSVTPITFVEVGGTGGASAWGDITGILSAQTDLQNELDLKAASVHTHDAVDVNLDYNNSLLGRAPIGPSTTILVGTGLETYIDGGGFPNLRVVQSYFDALYTALSHASRHQDGGADEISVTGLSGLLADQQTPLTHDIITKHSGFPGGATTFLRDDGTFAAPVAVPGAHATTHESGGTDPIPLDTLAAPTDITTLNATSAKHGLCPKLSGVGGQFLNGSGFFSTPNGLLIFAQTTLAVTGLSGALSISGNHSAVAVRSLAIVSQTLTLSYGSRLRIL